MRSSLPKSSWLMSFDKRAKLCDWLISIWGGCGRVVRTCRKRDIDRACETKMLFRLYCTKIRFPILNRMNVTETKQVAIDAFADAYVCTRSRTHITHPDMTPPGILKCSAIDSSI